VTSVPFGDLFAFIRNGMNVSQDKSGRGIPITRIETIADATVDGSRVGYANLREAECRGWLLQPGDILFSHINSVEHIGKCAVYQGSPATLVHGMNLLCMRCDESRLLPEFAKYLIRGSAFRRALAKYVKKAVNQASVSISDLRTIQVAVPPVPEQQRIVEVLDSAETLRAKRRAAIDQLDTFTQSIFHNMFGKAAVTPDEHNSVRVDEYVASFQGGRSVDPASDDDPTTRYRVLKVSAVTGMMFKADECKPVPHDYDPPNEHRLRDGDLLFSRANTSDLVGAVAYVEKARPDLLLPDKLWRFVWRDPARVEPKFVWYLFQTHAVRAEIARRATGTSGSMKNISQAKLMGIRTLFPPVELQRVFVAHLRSVEQVAAAYRQEMMALDELLASLQHRALTGQL
jgi:type I restriction enzyme, S subunit